MQATAALLLLLSWTYSALQAQPKQSAAKEKGPRGQQATAANQNQTPGDHGVESHYLKGTVSEDGKTFTEDGNKKTWSIMNPDSVKTYRGGDVRLTADVYRANRSILVVSVGF